MKLENNVYGAFGIGVKNGNYNAAWDRYPKQDGNGCFKASPYAFQFALKNLWYKKGDKVFNIKTIKEDGGVNKINERYENLFNKKDDNKSSYVEVKNNLLSCKDILNFGEAYTGKHGISITGIVQITDGINKFEDTNIVEEEILSPFSTEKKKDKIKDEDNEDFTENKKMSTCGTRITTDEAHYLHSFSIFANQYDYLIDDKFQGYSEDDYEDFKQTSLISVSNYNSKAKAGCKNEFGIFIKTKKNNNCLIDLNNLADYIKVYKHEEKVIYDLKVLSDLLEKIQEKIEDIEIYYNPRTITLKDLFKCTNVKVFDLITRGEIQWNV